MTSEQKIARLRVLLGSDAGNYTDTMLNEYLTFAEEEIVNQVYAVAGKPDDAVMPRECEGVQIFAVINGLNTQGAEGEVAHSDNGISRTFAYPDMVAYIKGNVIPFAKVVV